MTRRLIVTLLATVLAALAVSGLVTVALARWQARESTEQRLRDQAESLVAATTLGADSSASLRQQQLTRRVLREVRAALRVDGIEFLRIGPDGTVTGSLPAGVTVEDLDVAALQRGVTTSGSAGSLVHAAAPRLVGRSTVVAVVTAEASAGIATAARWFLVAAVVTVLLGAVVAVVVGRRLARPVRRADEAARALAAGELSTRLPEPGPDERDELADLARSINAMAAALERSRALDRQFLLSVSHDLRTPLTAIRGYAEAIVDEAAPAPKDAAAVIVAESERLERLVADLLTLARLDARGFALHPVLHDVREPVADATRAYAPAVERAGLTVVTDAPDGPAMVSADPERVRQILGNLLENAAKYARSTIRVEVVAEHGDWVVRVDDDGPGIPPDDLPHVFERLYASRLRPVRAEVGSGLGLAIVRQLAEAMGGSAAAGAAPSGGARIEVRLPAMPAPEVIRRW